MPTARMTVILMAFVIALVLVVPPWRFEGGMSHGNSAGYALVFSPPMEQHNLISGRESWSVVEHAKIDWDRLSLTLGAVLFAGAGVFLASKRHRGARIESEDS